MLLSKALALSLSLMFNEFNTIHLEIIVSFGSLCVLCLCFACVCCNTCFSSVICIPIVYRFYKKIAKYKTMDFILFQHRLHTDIFNSICICISYQLISISDSILFLSFVTDIAEDFANGNKAYVSTAFYCSVI